MDSNSKKIMIVLAALLLKCKYDKNKNKGKNTIPKIDNPIEVEIFPNPVDIVPPNPLSEITPNILNKLITLLKLSLPPAVLLGFLREYNRTTFGDINPQSMQEMIDNISINEQIAQNIGIYKYLHLDNVSENEETHDDSIISKFYEYFNLDNISINDQDDGDLYNYLNKNSEDEISSDTIEIPLQVHTEEPARIREEPLNISNQNSEDEISSDTIENQIPLVNIVETIKTQISEDSISEEIDEVADEVLMQENNLVEIINTEAPLELTEAPIQLTEAPTQLAEASTEAPLEEDKGKEELTIQDVREREVKTVVDNLIDQEKRRN